MKMRMSVCEWVYKQNEFKVNNGRKGREGKGRAIWNESAREYGKSKMVGVALNRRGKVQSQIKEGSRLEKRLRGKMHGGSDCVCLVYQLCGTFRIWNARCNLKTTKFELLWQHLTQKIII